MHFLNFFLLRLFRSLVFYNYYKTMGIKNIHINVNATIKQVSNAVHLRNLYEGKTFFITLKGKSL